MKALIVIVIIILLAVGFVMTREGGTAARSPQQTQAQQQAPTEQTAQSTPAQPRAQSAIGATADSVLNYGTGYTQMQVKKRQQSKLDAISQKHNQALESEAAK